jgi:hypothetical protein
VALTALTDLTELMAEACATSFGSGDADYLPESIGREDFRLYSNVSCRGWLRYCALRAAYGGSDTSTNQAASWPLTMSVSCEASYSQLSSANCQALRVCSHKHDSHLRELQQTKMYHLYII